MRGLRVSDIYFKRGIVSPVVHNAAVKLKTETSRTVIPVPIPASLS